VISNLPLLSVGLPTYNRPNGLRKTLDFLIHQNYHNIEIIISDNHSPNAEIKSILEEYSTKDDRIQYTIQAENIGAEANFNFVYQLAKGIYFFWITDDDEFDNDYFKSCIAFLESNANFIHCAGLVSYFDGEQFLYTEGNLSLEQHSSLLRMFKYFYNVQKNGIFYGVTRLYPKFESPIGLYIGSDWVYIAQLALLGKIKVLDNITARRDAGGGSATRAGMINRWKFNKFISLFFESYTAFKISKHLFDEKKVHHKYASLFRLPIQGFLFLFLNFKFLLNSIRRRIRS
jgi:glycosyltransferase involved in cell wall biosynthesis